MQARKDGAFRVLASWRCCRCVGLFTVLVLLGGSLLGVPASAKLSPAVEDLLWDLQIAPLEGDPPAFTLAGLDGTRHSLTSLKGQAVLLYFWATW